MWIVISRSIFIIINIYSLSDQFLSDQISLILRVFNNFCKRTLERKDYSEVKKINKSTNEIFLDNYPVNSLTVFTIDGSEPDYNIDLETGSISLTNYFSQGDIVLGYNAGYDESNIDPLLKDIFLSIIKNRYNSNKSNSLDGGQGDIKRMSITGVMSVEYQNSGKNGFNDYLDGFQDALESFRSSKGFFQ